MLSARPRWPTPAIYHRDPLSGNPGIPSPPNSGLLYTKAGNTIQHVYNDTFSQGRLWAPWGHGFCLFVAISPVLKGKECWRNKPRLSREPWMLLFANSWELLGTNDGLCRFACSLALLPAEGREGERQEENRRPVASVGSVANFWVELEHVACPPWDSVSWLMQMRGPNAYRLFHCLALQY